MSVDLTGKAVRCLRLPTVDYNVAPVSVVSAQIGDAKSRILLVTLYDDRGEIDLSNYTSAIVYAVLPDGELVNYAFEELSKPKNTQAAIAIPAGLLKEEGRVLCNIAFQTDIGSDTDSEGVEVLTSQGFYIHVAVTNITDNEGETDEEAQNILAQLLATAKKLEEYANELIAPEISADGDWVINGVDTNKPSVIKITVDEVVEELAPGGTPKIETTVSKDGKTMELKFSIPEGKGITSLVKKNTEGLVDTYEITFNDGDVITYTVTNGKSGIQSVESGVSSTTGEFTTTLITFNFEDGNTQEAEVKAKNGVGVETLTLEEEGAVPGKGEIIPPGGNVGEALVKKSDEDYDFEWGEVATKNAPEIGENGNWFIDGEDTGKPSRGEQGAPGQDGSDGVGITDVIVEETSTDGEYMVTKAKFNKTDGSSSTVEIKAKNGEKGDPGAPGQPGAPGAQGEPGEPGKDGKGFSFLGTWTSGTGQYVINDVVEYDGNSYCCIADISNGMETPDADVQHWGLFTEKGQKGDKGDPGAAGEPGLTPEQIQMFQYLAQNMTVTDGKVIFAVELEAPSFNAATE